MRPPDPPAERSRASAAVGRLKESRTLGGIVEKPSTQATPAREGSRIANARGVPGTFGAVALTAGGEAVMLTNHHVLFGAGARQGDPVWLVGGSTTAPTFGLLGRALRGKLGTVALGSEQHHVDCALCSIDGQRASRRGPAARQAVPGERVRKTGGATGATDGVVVAVAYPDNAVVDGRVRPAPRQLLVRSLTAGTPFSAEGDSGAVLRTDDGAIVGLLWGSNDRGESVACHIGPVLAALDVRLARPRLLAR